MRLGETVVVLFALSAAPAATAQDAPANPDSAAWVPAQLRDVGFDPQPGASVPVDAPWLDEDGRATTFGQRLRGRPVLLVPVYFGCPGLCSMVAAGAAKAIAPLPYVPGRDFDVVLFSFDEHDTPPVARERERNFLAACGHPEAADGVAVLTGGGDSIAGLCRAIGFRFARDATGQIAHAAGILVLTPDGRVSRTLTGIDWRPLDVRIALDEAGRGELGGFVDRALLFCYRWDPASGRYGAAVLRLVRVGGALTLLALAAFMWRSRRRSQEAR